MLCEETVEIRHEAVIDHPVATRGAFINASHVARCTAQKEATSWRMLG